MIFFFFAFSFHLSGFFALEMIAFVSFGNCIYLSLMADEGKITISLRSGEGYDAVSSYPYIVIGLKKNVT